MAKTKLTKLKVMKSLKATHGIKKYMCEVLGVNRQTLYRYLKSNPELESEMQEHLEYITDIAEFNLIENIKKGNPWAVRYWLSTRGKHRGYSTKQEAIFNGLYPMQVITTGVADPPMQTISIKIPDNEQV